MSFSATGAVSGPPGFARFADGFRRLAMAVGVLALLGAVGLAVVPSLLHRDGHHSTSYLTLKPAAPVRLSLAGTSTVVPIVATTTTPADGLRLAPADAPLVTWWQGSARPGAAHGQTLLTGHAQGDAGALGNLARVRHGEYVDVLTKQGTMRYQVASVRTFDPARYRRAALDLYKQDGGGGRLVMISAEAWDGSAYQRFVVLTGTPLGEPARS